MRRTFRASLALLLLAVIAGCGAPRQSQATAVPGVRVYTVGELLDDVPPGMVRAVGVLYLTPELTLLTEGLNAGSAGSPGPPGGRGLWLDSPPPLPADGPITQLGDVRYALVDARGRLEGPGEFGPGGRYQFKLGGPTIKPLSARELTLAQLIENSAAHEGQPVRLRGQLLAGPDEAILAEELGPGGVPVGRALQIKLAGPPSDPAVVAALRPTANPAVRFGAVEVTGLWRDGRLHPLLVTAL